MTSPAAPPEPESVTTDPPGRTRCRRCCRWGLGALVVGLLLAITLFPKAREMARRVNCAHNMKSIGLGCLMYTGNSGGVFPPNLDALVYTNNLVPGKVCHCPSNPTDAEAYYGPELRADYVYVGSGMYDDLDDAERCPIMFDAPTNHPGPWLNVLFIDGHVEGFPYATWDAVIAAHPERRFLTPEEGRARAAADHPPKPSPQP